MVYDLYELFEKIASEINFSNLSLNENTSEINIELTDASDINELKKLLDESDEFSSDAYEIINKNEYDIIIKFNDEIKYIDENEYNEIILSELKEYQKMYDELDLFSGCEYDE